MTPDSPIVVFDTDCVLCSGMVSFVLAREHAPELRFAGAWSDEGLALAAQHGFARSDLDETFLVLTSRGMLTRSEAFIAILRRLRAPWRWLASVLEVVPPPLRDAAYGFVARRRYRWFGTRKDCMVVPPAERHRFLGLRGASSARRPSFKAERTS